VPGLLNQSDDRGRWWASPRLPNRRVERNTGVSRHPLGLLQNHRSLGRCTRVQPRRSPQRQAYRLNDRAALRAAARPRR
jgi:hypothetical protein